MGKRTDYKAPWNLTVTIVTGSTVLFFAYLILLGFAGFQDNGWFWLAGVAGVPLAIVLVALNYRVSGYAFVDHCLWIKRLGWYTKIDLHSLRYAKVDPDAMGRAWRVLGNGGLFGFTGWYRNSRLGRFRVYATNPSLAVVLKFPQQIVVVTPEDPQGFVDDIADLVGEHILLPET